MKHMWLELELWVCRMLEAWKEGRKKRLEGW